MTQGFTLIELSQIDAEQFVLFQKYYKQFKEMVDEGVFQILRKMDIVDIHA